jgi:hypothetical protein
MPKRLINKIIASYREVPIWKVVEDLLDYAEQTVSACFSETGETRCETWLRMKRNRGEGWGYETLFKVFQYVPESVS